jgi:cytochrome P450
MFGILQEEFPEIAKCGVLYFDPWPIGFPMMAVVHPDMISQFIISPSLPKFFWMREKEFMPFSGGVDMVTSEGEVWKEQRAIYNPGFSTKNISSMVPWFLEEVINFRDRLLKAADLGKTIELESYAMDLALDVITRATL